MNPLLPVLAAAALSDPPADVRGLLVAARRGRVLHVVLDSGRSLTPTGRLRRAAGPICGRTPRGWRPAQVDGRPLCRDCETAVRCINGPAALSTAATWLTGEDIARTLVTARDPATVAAARGLLIESGLTGKHVLVDGQSTRLTGLVAQARDRVATGGRLTDKDRAWFSQVQNAPARRFPRRVS